MPRPRAPSAPDAAAAQAPKAQATAEQRFPPSVASHLHESSDTQLCDELQPVARALPRRGVRCLSASCPAPGTALRFLCRFGHLFSARVPDLVALGKSPWCPVCAEEARAHAANLRHWQQSVDEALKAVRSATPPLAHTPHPILSPSQDQQRKIAEARRAYERRLAAEAALAASHEQQWRSANLRARLGLSREGPLRAKALRLAYKRAALRYHPDKSTEPHAATAFAAICEAYQVLQSQAIE